MKKLLILESTLNRKTGFTSSNYPELFINNRPENIEYNINGYGLYVGSHENKIKDSYQRKFFYKISYNPSNYVNWNSEVSDPHKQWVIKNIRPEVDYPNNMDINNLPIPIDNNEIDFEKNRNFIYYFLKNDLFHYSDSNGDERQFKKPDELLSYVKNKAKTIFSKYYEISDYLQYDDLFEKNTMTYNECFNSYHYLFALLYNIYKDTKIATKKLMDMGIRGVLYGGLDGEQACIYYQGDFEILKKIKVK